jgi:hypothetical protein
MLLLAVIACNKEDENVAEIIVCLKGDWLNEGYIWPLLDDENVSFQVGRVACEGIETTPSSIDASVGVDMSLVASYNSEHATDYVALPEGTYQLDQTNVSIAGNSNQSDRINVLLTPGTKLAPATTYLLPVTIKSHSGGTLSNSKKTVYLAFTGSSNAYVSLTDGDSINKVPVKDMGIFNLIAKYDGASNYSGDVETEFYIDPTKVDKYNTDSATDYALLPVDNYSIERSSITIPGNRSTSPYITIVVSPDGLEINAIYLLPITISSVTTENQKFVVKDSTIYCRFSKVRNMVIIKSLSITGFSSPMNNATFTNRDGYIELVSTGSDPYLHTTALTESFIDVMNPQRKVVYAYEYQLDRAIGNAQIFYCRPNAEGGVSSGQDILMSKTGLAPEDNSKWIDFVYNCTEAYTNWGWGAIGHRFRYDFVADGVRTLYVRNMRIMVVEGDVD